MTCTCNNKAELIDRGEIMSDVAFMVNGFKVEVPEDFQQVFSFYYNETVYSIANIIGYDDIPKGLQYVVSRRILGKILNQLIISNNINTEDIDAQAGVGIASIKEGDVDVKFEDTLSPQKLLNNFLRNCDRYGKNELARYVSATLC